jgi:hypothetical protein
MAFALALAESHPNREALRREFESSAQASLARLENALTTDRSIDGFQDASKKIQKMLARRAE